MRSSGLLSGALLLVAAMAMSTPSTAERAADRLDRIGGRARAVRPTAGAWMAAAPRLASALAAAAVALVIGWPLGFAAGPVVFAACRRVLARLAAREPRPAAVAADAFAIELVAACLDAGATPGAALAAAGGEVGGPVGAELLRAADALTAGASPREALPEDGPLAPIAAVFRRSSQTGSRMSEQLIELAAQLRADGHFERLAKAQRVGVLSALPLGLCMLPAFLLLAVVPAVMGLGAGLLR